MSQIRALVLTGYGLNCDHETAYALELAGAEAQRIHINDLIDTPNRLADCKILVLGGGFSWGDDHGAGVIQAVRLKTRIGDHLLEFIGKGNLILGICNGFQTLVNLGLLPGFDLDYKTRSAALTFNDCGNFRDEWVRLAVNDRSPCVFTKGFNQLECPVEFPVRHGEGKFYAEDQILSRLQSTDQIVIRYAGPDGKPANGKFPHNPNGSVDDIAGICDPTGRIFGLMPHPEGFNHPVNHPDWTRQKEKQHRQTRPQAPDMITPGIRLFKNGVDYFST